MNGSIGENAVGLSLGGEGPTTFDDYGLSHPTATCHTPRPGEGRDGDTGRLDHGRWCL
jgi:hypothetical protein